MDDTNTHAEIKLCFQYLKEPQTQPMLLSILLENLGHNYGDLGVAAMGLKIVSVDEMKNEARVKLQAKYYKDFASTMFFVSYHKMQNFKVQLELINQVENTTE